MSWTTSNADLRTLLSDGPTDKLMHRKKVFGTVDGSNKSYKTFEFRRITDFTTAAAPLGVYLAGVHSAVSADFLEVGEFNFAVAPTANTIINATYYVQWFLDAELDQFLVSSINWLGLGSNVTQLAEGLRPAALRYSAGEAYQKLSIRWAQNLSETYLLEDAPDKGRADIVKHYMESAKSMKDEAVRMRNDFYQRQGQSLSPLFSNITGAVGAVTPRR